MDRDDGVVLVVWTAEHRLQLDVGEDCFRLWDLLFQLLEDLCALAIVAFAFTQLGEHLKVLGLARQTLEAIDLFADGGRLVGDGFRLRLVSPEIGRGHLGFEFPQASLQPFDVKETSPAQESAPGGRGLWVFFFSTCLSYRT